MRFFSKLFMLAAESFNKKSFLVMLLTAAVISTLAAYVVRYDMFGVYENAKVGFFILVCCAMWMGLFDSILVICNQRDVLERDKFSGLSPVGFMLASILFQAWHALLQSAIMFGITRLVIDWPAQTVPLLFDATGEYFATLFSITFAAQMLGLAVSAVVKRNQHALTFAPFLLIYELIMSETLFGLPAWLEPLRETTIVRWGLNALGTVYDIDVLPWQAEGKLDEIVAHQADLAGAEAQRFHLDPQPFHDLIANSTIDPAVMGVNHDLAEYAATNEHLLVLWAGLAVLAVVAMVIATVGFSRKVSTR